MPPRRPGLTALALIGALLGLMVYSSRPKPGSLAGRQAPLWRPVSNRRARLQSRWSAVSLLGVALVFALAFAGWHLFAATSGGSTEPVAVRAPTRTPTAAATLAPPPTSAPATEVEPTAPAPVEEQQPPAQVQSQPTSPPPPEQPPTNPPAASSPPPVANVAPPPPDTSGVDAAYTAAVLGRINRERASRGLSTVSTNGALQSAAENYAALLTNLHTLSHDANGLDLGTRLAAVGYSGAVMGEILWYGGGIFAPDETVDAWLASPGHNAIMLDPHFTAVGAACYVYIVGSDYENRCVVDFGG